MLFYVIAILVIVMDQLSKYLIRAYIDINETFTLWGVHLTHIENSGMAGGLFQGNARLFGVVAVFFVIGVLYFRRTGEMKGSLIDCSFGFLVGGAIGNGIDRLLFGQVTDFIIRTGGILNFADHAIEIGVFLLIIYGVVRWFKNKH
ncbi:signal peptidase II [Neobacillus rhizophilus]|uniref:Lipoprotein signal peptidase n=1 Tax=Neobacillus rhizophilus TaxID=2833579 RepID=A0A942U7V5_9BACI|nr:signal peptidase II [Neobacillus rhizophilus]MBS4214016.1 signal peptidase II [Neobacillus rhizophilus]MBU8917581.1 signal peptidase II [Bacillus sp. FJAT-29953]